MKKLLLIPALAILPVVSTEAATVNFTVTLPPTTTTGKQYYYGIVSYDASLAPTVGSSTLTIGEDPSITILLSFQGNDYTEADDTGARPDFPAISFTDGEVYGINFFAKNKNPGATTDGYIQIEGTDQLITYSIDGNSEETGTVSWPATTPVPETSAAMLGALASLFLLSRRNR